MGRAYMGQPQPACHLVHCQPKKASMMAVWMGREVSKETWVCHIDTPFHMTDQLLECAKHKGRESMSHVGPVLQDAPACGNLLLEGHTPKLFMNVDSFHPSTSNPVIGLPVCHLHFSDEGNRY